MPPSLEHNPATLARRLAWGVGVSLVLHLALVVWLATPDLTVGPGEGSGEHVVWVRMTGVPGQGDGLSPDGPGGSANGADNGALSAAIDQAGDADRFHDLPSFTQEISTDAASEPANRLESSTPAAELQIAPLPPVENEPSVEPEAEPVEPMILTASSEPIPDKPPKPVVKPDAPAKAESSASVEPVVRKDASADANSIRKKTAPSKKMDRGLKADQPSPVSELAAGPTVSAKAGPVGDDDRKAAPGGPGSGQGPDGGADGGSSGGGPVGGTGGGGGNLQPATLIKRIKPPYPATAMRRGIQGVVDVEILVDRTGRVRQVRVVKADPPGVFDQAVLDTLPSWRFNPCVKDGQPTESEVITQVRFGLE